MNNITDILPASISKILETNINAAISKRKNYPYWWFTTRCHTYNK